MNIKIDNTLGHGGYTDRTRIDGTRSLLMNYAIDGSGRGVWWAPCFLGFLFERLIQLLSHTDEEPVCAVACHERDRHWNTIAHAKWNAQLYPIWSANTNQSATVNPCISRAWSVAIEVQQIYTWQNPDRPAIDRSENALARKFSRAEASMRSFGGEPGTVGIARIPSSYSQNTCRWEITQTQPC